jgi:hypothetical protein
MIITADRPFSKVGLLTLSPYEAGFGRVIAGLLLIK